MEEVHALVFTKPPTLFGVGLRLGSCCPAATTPTGSGGGTFQFVGCWVAYYLRHSPV